MKNLKIDEDAHRILVDARNALEKRSIEHPNLSDAIRELERRAKRSTLPTVEKSDTTTELYSAASMA